MAKKLLLTFFMLLSLQIAVSQTHKVTLKTTGHGTVTITGGKTDYNKGEPVKLNVTQESSAYFVDYILAYKTDDPSVELTLEGESNTFEMPDYDVTVETSFTDQDYYYPEYHIYERTYSIPQQKAGDEEALRKWLEDDINGISEMKGFIITDLSFTPNSITWPIAGTEEKPTGTNGSFSFTVTLGKSESASRCIVSGPHGIIEAKKFVSTSPHDVIINKSEGGIVKTENESYKEEDIVKLTIEPKDGYELENITAYVNDETRINISIDTSDYTFEMPSNKVFIDATFNKESLVNIEHVIENRDYSIPQEQAKNVTELRAWLMNDIQSIPEMKDFTATDISFNSINTVFAEAGNTENPSGTNGGFSFIATIKDADGDAGVTSAVSGVINATQYISYKVEIKTSNYGSVSSNKEEYIEGDTVKFNINPESGYELDTLLVSQITNGGTENIPLLRDSTVIMQKHDLVVEPHFINMSDRLNIEKAKTAVESQDFTIAQETGNDMDYLSNWTTAQMLQVPEMIAVLPEEAIPTSTPEFIPAIAGTRDNPEGTDGSFDESIYLSYGTGHQVEITTHVTIKATEYITTYKVEIGTTDHGSVSPVKEEYAEGDTVKFNIYPDPGYELDTLIVFKILNDGAYNIPVSKDNTFVMQDHDLVVDPHFVDISDRLNIEKAETAVESQNYTIAQETGNDVDYLTNWVLPQLFQVPELMEVLPQEGIPTGYPEFTPAIAGTKDNPEGTDGSFDESIYLSYGVGHQVEVTAHVTIKATAYNPLANLEVDEQESLHATAMGNGLHITGLTPGKTLYIYNMQGMLLYENKVSTNEQNVQLNNHGIYIVVYGNKSIKANY